MEGSEIKPARAPPPKPAPFLPQRTSPSVAPPVLPGTPPVPHRKPPPFAPPPLPPRVDLGEEPVEVVSSIKELSSNDFKNKGSPKLKPKERPEITMVSAKPMDSSGVIPPPSAPIQPAPVCEGPKVPQKPGRKSKGREPPPRPKTRPVSELTLETDEQVMGPVIAGERKHAQVIPNKGEEEKTNNDSGVKNAPVVPARKIQNDRTGDGGGEEGNMNDNSNLEEKLELNQRTESEVAREDHVLKVAAKPTVITAKPVENEPRSVVEVDGVNNNPAVPVADMAPTGKKSKPTVIMAKPKKKMPSSQEIDGQQESNEQEEAGKVEKSIPSQGGIPPPPAKKPKPAVKPKPSSSTETTNKESAEEKKLDAAVAPKPKARPTVILPTKLPKVTEASKPSESAETAKNMEESQAQVKPSRPTVILPAKPPPKVTEAPKSSEYAKDRENEQAQVKPASAETAERVQEGGREQEQKAVKPKRVPTVIRAARPEGQDSSEGRKQPKRPQRGPSVRKAAPSRPVTGPAKENEELDKVTSHSQEEGVSNRITEEMQERKLKPPRPVSIPGFKDNETLIDAKKIYEADSPEEAALNRKGSRKRPPAPRPPMAEHVRGEIEPTPGAHVPDEKSKDKHRPAPPRPPAVELVRGEVEPTPETHDKTHVPDDKPKGKTKPPRPSSRDLDNKPLKHLPEEISESHLDDKRKPARPAPVAPKADTASRNVAETRTIGESSADDHVKGTSNARDSAGHEKASSKAKPKPPRPTPSSGASKNKPHRPSGPTAKPTKKARKEPAASQVSSVCETYIEPSAIALYDYEPDTIDDLAFSAGDEIVLVKKVDNDWYIGRLGDQQGMFPVKFVEIIEDLPQEVKQETQPVAMPASSPFDVMALYDFHGNKHDGELVFTAGETIRVIEKINDDWLRGEYRGRTGAFPCSFVDISTDVINQLPLSEIKVAEPKSDKGAASDSGRHLHCKALFDYSSDVPDDLSFNAGDVIKIHKRISDDWIEGELNGRVGMFPLGYVEMVEDTQKQGTSQPEETKKSTVEYNVALYDFTGSAADELSFKKGDKIGVTEVISDDWLRGKLGRHEGMFPRAFVRLSKESVREPQPVKTAPKVTPKAKALFDFDGEFEDELSFKVDDDIVLLERVNEEWLKGQVNSRVGRFPSAFVKILTPLP